MPLGEWPRGRQVERAQMHGHNFPEPLTTAAPSAPACGHGDEDAVAGGHARCNDAAVAGRHAVCDNATTSHEDAVSHEQDLEVAMWAARAGAALLAAAEQEPQAAGPSRQSTAASIITDVSDALSASIDLDNGMAAATPDGLLVSPALALLDNGLHPPAAPVPCSSSLCQAPTTTHAGSPPTLRVATTSEGTDLALLFGQWRMRGQATQAAVMHDDNDAADVSWAHQTGAVRAVAPVHRGSAGPRYPTRAAASLVGRRGSSQGSGEDSEQRMLSCSTLLAAAAAYEVMDSHRARARGTLASQRAALHQRTNDEQERGRGRGRNPFWQVQ